MFTESYMATVGCDFSEYSVVLPREKKNIVCQIWDIAGQDRFQTLTRPYYKNASACLVVFDITDKEWQNSTLGWLEAVKESCLNERDTLMPLLLIANKSDLDDNFCIDNSDALDQFCEQNDFNGGWFECSAKDDFGIEECMHQLVNKISMDPESTPLKVDSSETTVILDQQGADEKSNDFCCF
eukprot:TRINITY_DN4916_c0_g2_i2.p1 TRINITY_DN4916_c0_g2~~TRINITY_DN4916_c0_g2_i2.p1  ORF type:complete len:183 (+),score=56.31 TRINITY_DN4916_c0_g2_i2:91-639(+)